MIRYRLVAREPINQDAVNVYLYRYNDETDQQDYLTGGGWQNMPRGAMSEPWFQVPGLDLHIAPAGTFDWLERLVRATIAQSKERGGADWDALRAVVLADSEQQ